MAQPTIPDILYSQQMQLDICAYFGLNPNEVQEIKITRTSIDVTFQKTMQGTPSPGKPYAVIVSYPLIA
jgi:hypothetical protein